MRLMHFLEKWKLTLTSPTRPYSFQSCPNSNSAEISSVCSFEQGGYLPPSRSSDGVVHLDKDINCYVNICKIVKNLLWAPILNNTGQHYLFRIVPNVWPKAIHSSTKVVVCAANDLRSRHPGF